MSAVVASASAPVLRRSLVRGPLHGAVLIAANLLGVAAFAWPFVLPALAGESAHGPDAPVILVVLLACIGLLLFLELERGGMGPKAVALIGVLGACMVALRIPGSIGGFSALFIVVLTAGNAFGPSFGFLLGAIGTFASGLFVGGIGPWLPFQMVAIGWVGAGAGLLPRSDSWRIRLSVLALYGFVTGFLFGALMNLWFWPFVGETGATAWSPSASPVENFHRYMAFYALTSFAWDSLRAVGNVALVVLLGRPLLGALDRAARRMRIDVR